MTHNLTIFLILVTSVTLPKQALAYNLTECTRFHTENITGGQILSNGSYHYKDKVYPPGHFGDFNHYLHENGTEIGTESHVRGCNCTHSERKCIRVCCPEIKKEVPEICPHLFDGQVFLNITRKEIFIQQYYTLVYDDIKCKTGDPYEKFDFEFDFYENGSIFVKEENTFFDYDRHCVSVDSETENLVVSKCVEPEDTYEHRYRILGIGMLMSVPFLLITFIVYGAIPELRNTHGMSLMSYVGGLMVGYTFLGSVQIKHNPPDATNDETHETLCTIAGYIIYFSFMLSFFWLNTMCFDIFWTFRRLRGNANAGHNFLYYCIYAWGMAILLTVVALLIDISSISNDYKPGIYKTNKYFLKENKIVEFLYLYMILLILVCTNIVFFVVTAYRIKKVQSETSAIVNACDSSCHSKHKDDKFRFLLYLRLFIIMGVTWSMEILSWFIDKESPWFYVTDLVNCLQGVLIFLLVVCNEKVRKLIVKRFNYFSRSKSSDNGPRPAGSSMTGHQNDSFQLNEGQDSRQSKTK